MSIFFWCLAVAAVVLFVLNIVFGNGPGDDMY